MFVLRPEQQECLDNVKEDLLQHNKIGVIAPPAFGKTETFIAVARDYLEDNPDKVVLVLSHLQILTVQTSKRFKKRTPNLRTGILQGQKIPNVSDKIVIGTVHSAKEINKVNRWLRGRKDKVGLVIADEFHVLLGNAMFVKALEQHNAKLVCFTASPYRDGYLMTNLLDTVSYTISMQELIDMKRLVPPIINQIMNPAGIESDELIMRTLALHLEKEKGNPAVMFWRTVEEARAARNVFEANGIKCSVVTGDVKGNVRDNIMDRFNAGEIEVLSTCDVLTAGADMPILEVIHMPYGTKSPTSFIQRVGRGLRPEDGDSLKSHHKKQDCRIYMGGEEPIIKSGFYRRLEHMIRNEGSESYEYDLFDELEFLELSQQTGSEKYIWTSEACEIIREMKRIGLENLASKLSKKDFPPRYLKNLSMISDSICEIESDNFQSLDKAIRKTASKWIFPSGKLIGRHVREAPYYYRKFVLEKFPDTQIGRMIYDWWVIKKRD